MRVYLILAFMAVGALARRRSGRDKMAIIAGATAGLVLAILGMATFAVIDNAYLPVVMHQSAKIAEFRASGLTSMRAFIDTDLEKTTPGVAILAAGGGVIFAALGAFLVRPAEDAWSRLRSRTSA
jgi:hypothetical protein